MTGALEAQDEAGGCARQTTPGVWARTLGAKIGIDNAKLDRNTMAKIRALSLIMSRMIFSTRANQSRL